VPQPEWWHGSLHSKQKAVQSLEVVAKKEQMLTHLPEVRQNNKK